MLLKNLKFNDLFTKKEISFPNEDQVWVKSCFDRSSKKYLCYKFSDVNTFCLISGNKDVFVDFTL